MSPDPSRLPDLIDDGRGGFIEVPPESPPVPPAGVYFSGGQYVPPPAPVPPAPKTVAEDAALMGKSFDEVAPVWAQRAATRFALSVRDAGSLAHAVHVGSEIEVVGGRSVPYGWYVVKEHYRFFGEPCARIAFVDPFSTAKVPHVFMLRADSADYRAAPNWPAAFSGWGDFGPVAAGACRAGLDSLVWNMIADWFEDDPARLRFVPVTREHVEIPGVPVGLFLAALRATIAASPLYAGVPAATGAAHRLTLNPPPRPLRPIDPHVGGGRKSRKTAGR
jgi:hypothetical protein